MPCTGLPNPCRTVVAIVAIVVIVAIVAIVAIVIVAIVIVAEACLPCHDNPLFFAANCVSQCWDE